MKKSLSGPVAAGILISLAAMARADGPLDNNAATVRPVPPPGIAVPDADRQSFLKELGQLEDQIKHLRKSENPEVKALLPDVEIFSRAVREALELNQFFTPDELKAGHELLRLGLERAELLEKGLSPWTDQTGLVVRGYVSRIDRTVQPYGLVIPATYRGGPIRLDVWLHGRGEKLTELAFLNQRRMQVGQIAPAHTIVLHPYGRYCNAFKFAGEIDVLESMESVKQRYQVDESRIAIRGFSMGGAGCWQLAVHYPDLWFAANPGAGFAETPEFLKTFQQETLNPTSWEKTLWKWYDCNEYAANLFNCPTVAYSGEFDQQKQAADLMQDALAHEQLTLTHLIGPQTKHSIHPASAVEIERRLSDLALSAGHDRVPRRIQFVTTTLKYHRSHWLKLNALEKHWEQARAEAEIIDDHTIRVTVKNVAGFSLDFAAGTYPFDLRQAPTVSVNGKSFPGPKPGTDRSWSFHWWQGGVHLTTESPDSGLRKRPNLQGPIDDAFLDTFLIVRPSGKSHRDAIGRWCQSELDHLVREWRRHFRGDALIKDDTAVTEEDMRSAHLILFGDFQSNAILRRISDKLPVRWNEQSVSLAGQTWNAESHAPVLIYPNPLQPKRYVVLNSGFTFREYDYLNNARQVPRLPDWAAVDIRTPPSSQYPGKIVAAGFFDERWQ